METAYFAGGCFWCITPTFKQTEGVLDVVSGYSGGDEINPVYADVKHQRTGHRETIRIDYRPDSVTFAELFDIYLNGVDPFDGDGRTLTGDTPIHWRYTFFPKHSGRSPKRAFTGWRRKPVSRSASASNPSRTFTAPRKNIRTTTSSIPRNSGRN